MAALSGVKDKAPAWLALLAPVPVGLRPRERRTASLRFFLARSRQLCFRAWRQAGDGVPAGFDEEPKGPPGLCLTLWRCGGGERMLLLTEDMVLGGI